MPYLVDAMSLLASAIQVGAALIIGLAALSAIAKSLWLFFARGEPETNTEAIRLRLGRWLVVALEFQVAADILRTAVAPTWNEIGQLAAIIVLRTVLNFFLQMEIERTAKRGSSTIA